jgi:serine/threonine-protein phosphatase 6 regulatory subunit 3
MVCINMISVALLNPLITSSSQPKGVRLGYMGHLMLISEDVITAMSRFPPDLRLNIGQYAPQPQWDQFVTGRYNETKQEDSRPLGGGKPLVKPGTTRDWKVDENEPHSEGSSRIESPMQGEFRRADALNSPSIKQTADFGPAPMDDDDDNNIISSRAPHVSFRTLVDIAYNERLLSSSPDILPKKWASQISFVTMKTTTRVGLHSQHLVSPTLP